MISRYSADNKKIFTAVSCFVLLVALGAGSTAHSEITPGEFSAMVVPSTDYAIHDRWYKTLAETGPKLRHTDQVNRDQILCLYLFVAGYSTDSTGYSDVVFDFSIKDASGREAYGSKDLLALDSRVDNPNNLMMSATTPLITLESKHEFGMYTIDVEVRDRVSGLTARTSDTLELKPYQPVETAEDVLTGEWMTFYYRNPEPQALVNACIVLVSSDVYEQATAPIYGFLTGTFEQNPQLIPHLIAKLSGQK